VADSHHHIVVGEICGIPKLRNIELDDLVEEAQKETLRGEAGCDKDVRPAVLETIDRLECYRSAGTDKGSDSSALHADLVAKAPNSLKELGNHEGGRDGAHENEGWMDHAVLGASEQGNKTPQLLTDTLPSRQRECELEVARNLLSMLQETQEDSRLRMVQRSRVGECDGHKRRTGNANRL